MREISLDVKSGHSKIYVDSARTLLPRITAGRRVISIIDSALVKSHDYLIPAGEVIPVPSGEESKSLEVTQQIYQRLFDLKADRNTLLVGIGGGSVSDLSGYVGATYLRGLPTGFIPTTLLAQVDASIGGKNGVNFNGIKNLIGTTRQPEFCLCDPETLKTLPKREIASGFAEVIKHSIISRELSFDLLEQRAAEILALESELISQIIGDSIAVKAGVVTRDEFEKNERKLLNLGHTIGHGIEVVCKVAHGEAVGLGMILEAKLAAELGLCNDQLVSRIERLIKNFSLPTMIPFDSDAVAEATLHDKKRKGEQIIMPLPRSIGNCTLEPIGVDQLRRFLCR